MNSRSRTRSALAVLAAGRFNPNAAGYQAYTAALTAAINPSRLK